MKNLNDIKSDVLILLVGTSPMPNLIAICSRIKNGGTVHLIHTSETKNISKALKDFIKKLNIDSESHEYSISDEKKSQENMERILDSINMEDESKVYELVYTGGTKIMSTKAYTLVKKKFKNANINALLTYLDGEASEIRCKNLKDNSIGILKYSEIKETLQFKNSNEIFYLKIDDIIKMHSKSPKYDKKRTMCCNTVSFKIYELLKNSNEEQRNEILELMKDFFKTLTSLENEFKNLKVEVLPELKEIKLKQTIDSVLDKGYKHIFNDFQSIVDSYKNDYKDLDNNQICDEIIKDLKGIWFEKALLKFLNENIKCDDIKHSVKNQYKDESKLDPDDLFEVDLLVLKDYKLHCISVTTSQNYVNNRSKFYEIKLRTSLLTGIDGSGILVSLYENTDSINNDYENVWGREDNIIAIGSRNIVEIENKLKKVIGGESYGD